MNVASLQGKSQAELLAIIAAMGQQAQSKLTLKVGKSGGISVYGFGRYPVTLYVGGWERMVELCKSGAVDRFIETNRDLLSTGKGDPRFAKAEDEA